MSPAGTVLVVEDDASVLAAIRRVLATKGFRVLEARNGVEALQRLSVEPADLVITDAAMPLMGGLELAGTLRSRGNEVPILMMSGYVSGMREAIASVEGPTHFLQKPTSAEQILATVARMLARP